MKLSEVRGILEKQNAEYCFSVYVPSLKNKLSFLPLKLADIKSISKFSMLDEDEFKLALIGTVSKLCVTPDFDVCKLTELDLTAILIAIIDNSTVIQERYKFTCDKCKSPFKTKVDFTKIYERIKSIDFTAMEKEWMIGNNTIKVELKIPIIEVLLQYKEEYKLDKQSYVDQKIKDFLEAGSSFETEDDELQKREEFKTHYDIYQLQYLHLLNISKMYFNGEQIEMEENTPLMDLYHGYSEILTSDIFEEIKDCIVERYNYLNDLLKISITCPHCKHNMDSKFDPEVFFS